jgi:small-conductance mechanosensitive channel
MNNSPMDKYLNNETARLVIAGASFILLLIILFFVYKFLIGFFKKKLIVTSGKFTGFVIDLLKIPALWIVYWILLKIFSAIFLSNYTFSPYLLHINTLLIIFSVTWIATRLIKAGAYYLQNRLDVGALDNLSARKRLTQIKVLIGLANSVIIVIAIAVGLLTFDKARAIGVSLLTSAGIIGIVVGFAAQKSLGLVLAGIQIAFTQPIRIDDVVIVEGEWGRIEEITLTYVVVKIWDERRMILPVTWFLEKPFQNWTRTTSDITGSIFLYVDYNFPVESLRKIIPELLKGNKNWDGRIWNVQVTKATETYKEIRVLASSSDASKNWDLKTTLMEKLTDYINENHPGSFAKIRTSAESKEKPEVSPPASV